MTALRVELRKILTTRMWWILALALAGYMAFLAGILAVAFANPEAMGGAPGESGGAALGLGETGIATAIYTLPASTGYVFPLIVGALSVTAEFRYQTISGTFLATPRRGVVLAAKMVSSVALGLVFGIVGTLMSAGVGAGVLAAFGEPTLLGEPEVRRSLVLTCAAMAIWAAVGVGFGAWLTNQVASIIVVLAFTQFVEPILRFLLMTNAGMAGIARFLPGAAGEALAGGSLFGGVALADPLTWWQGGLILLAYAVAFAVVGRFTSLRKDIG